MGAEVPGKGTFFTVNDLVNMGTAIHLLYPNCDVDTFEWLVHDIHNGQLIGRLDAKRVDVGSYHYWFAGNILVYQTMAFNAPQVA
jgi:hypothetical protein